MNQPCTDNSQVLTFNGVDGATGSYLLPPLSIASLAQVARRAQPQSDPSRELQWWVTHFLQQPPFRSLKAGIDAKRLDETGWGVIYAAGIDPAVRDALKPLLDLRSNQTGSHFREYATKDGYQLGESKLDFLRRHGVGPGPADPQSMPYYLLLVGDPTDIPYRFQYQLDVQYAVGRLAFDTVEEYANYAQSVVAAEESELDLTRRATFFGVANRNDKATELGTRHLVEPLSSQLAVAWPDWHFESHHGRASKSELQSLLTDDEPLALLFTVSHGVGFHIDDPRQREFQGALLCEDWPGPEARGEPLCRDHFFAAEDVTDEAQLHGLITLHFACYGAGTPRLDDFAHSLGERAAVAPRDFVARLPQRLLAHPRGGALACIGHIERAWGFSFLWPQAGRQLASFETALNRLLDGYPVGAAMEVFNQRYAELSCDLTSELEELEFGRKLDEIKLCELWTARNDARNYVVLGDPAVRLAARRSRPISRRSP